MRSILLLINDQSAVSIRSCSNNAKHCRCSCGRDWVRMQSTAVVAAADARWSCSWHGCQWQWTTAWSHQFSVHCVSQSRLSNDSHCTVFERHINLCEQSFTVYDEKWREITFDNLHNISTLAHSLNHQIACGEQKSVAVPHCQGQWPRRQHFHYKKQTNKIFNQNQPEWHHYIIFLVCYNNVSVFFNNIQ